jgi:hypothetical protein
VGSWSRGGSARGRHRALARLAEEIGARELALQAYAWCLGDLLELGDIDGVGREITRYAHLADELRQPIYR